MGVDRIALIGSIHREQDVDVLGPFPVDEGTDLSIELSRDLFRHRPGEYRKGASRNRIECPRSCGGMIRMAADSVRFENQEPVRGVLTDRRPDVSHHGVDVGMGKGPIWPVEKFGASDTKNPAGVFKFLLALGTQVVDLAAQGGGLAVGQTQDLYGGTAGGEGIDDRPEPEGLIVGMGNDHQDLIPIGQSGCLLVLIHWSPLEVWMVLVSA